MGELADKEIIDFYSGINNPVGGFDGFFSNETLKNEYAVALKDELRAEKLKNILTEKSGLENFLFKDSAREGLLYAAFLALSGVKETNKSKKPQIIALSKRCADALKAADVFSSLEIKYTKARTLGAFIGAFNDNTRAVIAETAEEDFSPINKDFLKQAREVAKARDAAFIIDETLFGGGKTGDMFSFTKIPLAPDIIVCANISGNLPFSAVGASGKYTKPFTSKIEDYSPNEYSVSAAISALLFMDSLLAEVKKKNKTIVSALKTCDKVENVCSFGMLISFTVSDAESDALACKTVGLSVGYVGKRIIICPRLDASAEEISRGAKNLKEVFGGAKDSPFTV